MNEPVKRMWVIGASGRLGSGLLSASGHLRSMYARTVPREQYNKWDSKSKARAWLDASGFIAGDVMVNASGITDASSPQAALERANVDLPTIAARAAIELGGRALTLGSVLEQSKAVAAANPYIRTKCKLAANAKQSANWTHLQLHTVFGGKVPTPHMFTGLMFKAIQHQVPLKMTAGKQIREYHHVDDISIEIVNFLSGKHSATDCVIEMSANNHVELRDLAISMFSAFDSLPLLKIDEKNIPIDDIYVRQKTHRKNQMIFSARPIIPAMVAWYKSHIQKNRDTK